MNKIKFMFLLTGIFLFFSLSYAKDTAVYDGAGLIGINMYDKVFSPNGDGFFDEITFEISLLQNKLKIKKWELDIVNLKTNEIAHKFSGEKEIPKILKWDGTQNGKVSEGGYKYVFTAIINKKNIRMEENGIVIDVTSPYVSLNSSLDTVVLDDDKFLNDIEFVFNVGDETGIDTGKTRLQIINFNDKVVKEWVFQTYDAVPDSIIWDGKDDIYGMAVPVGEYRAVLTVCDIVNNTTKIYKNITVFKKVLGDVSEIVVKEEPRGLVVNLSSNILFSSGKSVLKDEATISLNETIKLLNAYPANKVLIEGYTDSTGKKDKNLKLSYDRAQSVYFYFVQNGVQAERIQTVGYGEENPIAANKTSKGRALNRRVNIVILKNEEKQENDAEHEKKPQE